MFHQVSFIIQQFHCFLFNKLVNLGVVGVGAPGQPAPHVNPAFFPTAAGGGPPPTQAPPPTAQLAPPPNQYHAHRPQPYQRPPVIYIILFKYFVLSFIKPQIFHREHMMDV